MRDYVARATMFINQIAPYIVPCIEENEGIDIYWKVESAICDFCTNCHRNVRVCHGASRIALVTSDYVVKFDYSDDYNVGTCESECKMYALACKEGYEHLLAKITRVLCNGHMFYIMPRIRWIGAYYDFVGLDEDEEDWLNDHIEDLHINNYGVADGHTVVIDYACY